MPDSHFAIGSISGASGKAARTFSPTPAFKSAARTTPGAESIRSSARMMARAFMLFAHRIADLVVGEEDVGDVLDALRPGRAVILRGDGGGRHPAERAV